jgi:hypothetical protein
MPRYATERFFDQIFDHAKPAQLPADEILLWRTR